MSEIIQNMSEIFFPASNAGLRMRRGGMNIYSRRPVVRLPSGVCRGMCEAVLQAVLFYRLYYGYYNSFRTVFVNTSHHIDAGVLQFFYGEYHGMLVGVPIAVYQYVVVLSFFQKGAFVLFARLGDVVVNGELFHYFLYFFRFRVARHYRGVAAVSESGEFVGQFVYPVLRGGRRR